MRIRNLAAQSAMEYIITYGWAMLIIAIVLAALFNMYVFSQFEVPTACYSSTGFYCANPTIGTSGYLNVTMSQTIFSQMSIIGTACSTSQQAPLTFQNINTTDVNTGQIVKLNFKCPILYANVGSPFSGYLWILYNTPQLTGQIQNFGKVILPISSADFKNSFYVYVTNYGSNNITVIKMYNFTVVNSITSGGIEPSGVVIIRSYAYVSNYGSDNVAVINVTNGEVIKSIPVGYEPIMVSASPNGKYVFTANYGSNNITVISTATNSAVASINVGNAPYSVISNPAGTYMYVANSGSNNVTVINEQNFQPVASINVGQDPIALAVAPDGTRVFVANYNSDDASIISTATNAVIGSVPLGANPIDIDLTTDGAFLYSANYGSSYISYINTTNGNVVTEIPVGSGINTVVVTPDGAYLMVTQQYSNMVSLVNTTSGKVVKTIEVGSQPTNIGMAYGTSSYQHV